MRKTVILALNIYILLSWIFCLDIQAFAPYGLESMAQLERLPFLKLDTISGQTASYDRSGANSDGFKGDNFLYTSENGEKVMAELNGPGCIYRMWFTGFNKSNANLKIYVDGETTPRLNSLLNDLFEGTNPPFLKPLVVNNKDSSGGFVSYLPIPFERSIKITTNGNGLTFFYQIGYQLFSPETNISSWTKTEDFNSVLDLWRKVGRDPKTDKNSITESGALNIAAHETRPLLDVVGSHSISSIKLKIPELTYERHGDAVDTGRAHRGYSQFVAAIDPNNQGVTLKRRSNYGIANQKADVFVDGAWVGQWHDSGSDTTYKWRDTTFNIPSPFTAGKNSITVTLEFISAAGNWTEYRYWIYSDGYLTDEFDVGDTLSEVEHSYVINNRRICPQGDFEYPPPTPEVLDILNNTWIRIYWDGEKEASVHAPIGSFFGMGQFGNYATHAIPFGMNADNMLYFYFPMPFEHSARIELYNDREQPSGEIEYEVTYAPFTSSFAEVGYFKTSFRIEDPSTTDEDLTLLDVEGSGHFVGVVQSVQGDLNRSFLEGDERFYIDDSRTPAIHGTGTEDFYSGGWYFNQGLFSRPMHGYVGHIVTDTKDKTAMYRLYLHDAVAFRKNIKVSIEHGPTNNQPVTDWSLTFYYHKPDKRAVLTDTLDINDSESEAEHSYAATQIIWSGTVTSAYLGDNCDIAITEDGKMHTGISAFRLGIDPNNQGVLLRRMYDHSGSNQKADVYVDGTYIGQWFNAGNNPSLKWEDSDFMIPASSTEQKSSIRVEIASVSQESAWSEFLYSAYSLKAK